MPSDRPGGALFPDLAVTETDSEILLERARALEADDPMEAGRRYREILDRYPACVEASNALEQLGHRDRFGAWMRINCVIHPDDDIFAFIAGSPFSSNPIRDYLADGWRTLSEMMLVLERLGRPLVGMGSVLEFASGFGRFTRHLAAVLPGRVTCSDIMPGAMAFAREQFGVRTLDSAMTPEQIEFPERYELIFVLSLFTHLPVAVWGRWLKALAGALEPGGVLLLSVHNEAYAHDLGCEFDADGVCFLPSSESSDLEPAQYGTTLTTRRVVEHQIERALGLAPVLYVENAFWVGQDAVAVVVSSD